MDLISYFNLCVYITSKQSIGRRAAAAVAADKKTSSGMAIVVIDEVLAVQGPKEDDEDIEQTGTIIWNYYKSVGVTTPDGIITSPLSGVPPMKVHSSAVV